MDTTIFISVISLNWKQPEVMEELNRLHNIRREQSNQCSGSQNPLLGVGATHWFAVGGYSPIFPTYSSKNEMKRCSVYHVPPLKLVLF